MKTSVSEVLWFGNVLHLSRWSAQQVFWPVKATGMSLLEEGPGMQVLRRYAPEYASDHA